MNAPVSKVESLIEIKVVSDVDAGFSRNILGNVIQTIPSISITAELHGIWDNPQARDTDMKNTMDSLMAAYRSQA